MDDSMSIDSSKPGLLHKGKTKKKSKSGGFESMNLSENIYRGVKRKGYTVPTPIQRKTMPMILKGSDIVAMARTGSGKSAAFIIPMLERLKQHDPEGGIRALILSPTRDLALQTLKFTQELGRYTDLQTILLVGGDSMESQFEELMRNPDIIIATPGRLMHHLTEVDDLSLHSVEYVVFDEADSLFGMGFAEQLHRILSSLSANRQCLLFSATLPASLAEFAKVGLRDPQLVRLDLESRVSPDLKLVFFTMRQDEKLAALSYLVREHISANEQTLIFAATKHHVEFLNALFKEEGIFPSICYGDMDQDARKIHISKFRARKTMLLIVTDVAARGIDIPLLDNIINWDFPPKPKIFVHRVGRAARAGRTGTAYSFVTSEDLPYLLDLHLFLSKPVKPAPREKEIVHCLEEATSRIDQALLNGETFYGRFPQDVLNLISDRLRTVISSCTDLTSLQKTCINAFHVYLKTKPPASRASVRRAKSLPQEGLHPLFLKFLREAELSALAFSECLKTYKPKQTILEAEGEAARGKPYQGAYARGLDVMRKKRAVHEEIINSLHQQNSREKEESTANGNVADANRKAKLPSGKQNARSFKDEEYYISLVPMNLHLEKGLSVNSYKDFSTNRLDAAVLDLVADDSVGLKKQKSTYHWDRRQKKYIKLNNGERVTASGKIKTEGGEKVKSQKMGIYRRWKERSHRGLVHENVPDNSEGMEPKPYRKCRNSKGKIFSGNRNRSVTNRNISSELKDFEQIRKKRQQNALKLSYAKNKGTKSRKRKIVKGKSQKRKRN